MSSSTAWADCPRELHPSLAKAERRHGESLNVVRIPPGVCAACRGPGPTSVHPRVLVWLRCGHVRELPALKIDLSIDHSARLHFTRRHVAAAS